MRSPRLFSFLGNQSNRLSQGRAKQTRSSTGSTIMTTAVRVELLAADLRFAPREVVSGDALASDGVGERP